MGGIKDMTEMPGALFIVDPRKERIAVSEAKKLNIPIVTRDYIVNLIRIAVCIYDSNDRDIELLCL